MRFIKMQSAVSLIMVGTFITIPALANAKDLIITNNLTSSDFAFTVNSICSPEIGVVYHHNMKIIFNSELKKICHGNSETCDIQAHKNTCDGVDVGGIRIYGGSVTKVNGIDDSIAVYLQENEKELDFSIMSK